MKKRSVVKRKPIAEINVVPYIDVMLVLLVVFMVTAPMMTQGVKLDLPDADAPVLEQPKEDIYITLSVKANGEYFLDYRKTEPKGDEGEKKFTAMELDALLKEIAAVHEANPKMMFFIEADGKTPYANVLKLMAGMQNSGVTNIHLVSEPDQSSQEKS
jgi:biopolymer transport protein TolR